MTWPSSRVAYLMAMMSSLWLMPWPSSRVTCQGQNTSGTDHDFLGLLLNSGIGHALGVGLFRFTDVVRPGDVQGRRGRPKFQRLQAEATGGPAGAGGSLGRQTGQARQQADHD